MNIRRFSVGLIFSVIVVLVANETFPNGMSPPKPSTKPLVTAKCKEKHRDLMHEIFRVQVKSGDHSSSNLTFQIDGVSKEIAVEDLKTVSLCADEVDRDDFITATLVCVDDVKEKSAKVQVITPFGDVILSGFTRKGRKYSVKLSDCKVIEFFHVPVSIGNLLPEDQFPKTEVLDKDRAPALKSEPEH